MPQPGDRAGQDGAANVEGVLIKDRVTAVQKTWARARFFDRSLLAWEARGNRSGWCFRRESRSIAWF
jgi:hypothetical protein